GIMVKDGAGLERLSEVDTVVFDKTGTLTLGRLELRDLGDADPGALALAGALAAHSRHPQSVALVAAQAARGGLNVQVDEVREIPGQGVEARSGTALVRLGRADWALGDPDAVPIPSGHPCTVLSRDGRCVAVFAF